MKVECAKEKRLAVDEEEDVVVTGQNALEGLIFKIVKYQYFTRRR